MRHQPRFDSAQPLTPVTTSVIVTVGWFAGRAWSESTGLTFFILRVFMPRHHLLNALPSYRTVDWQVLSRAEFCECFHEIFKFV